MSVGRQSRLLSSGGLHLLYAPLTIPLVGLQREKLSPGASSQDFAVKASLRRSSNDEAQSPRGSQRLLLVGLTCVFRQRALHRGMRNAFESWTSPLGHRMAA